MGRAPTKTDTDPAVGRGVDQIIERAINGGVSDIHIEPGERLVLVRYRRGGLLYIANKLPPSSAQLIVAHIKELAGLDPKQTRSPQAGQYELNLGQRQYSMQVATLPTLDGEKVTIGIAQNSKTAPDLEELGLWGSSLKLVEHALSQTYGLIVVVGRQNGRVATTLAAMLQALTGSSAKAAFINSEATSLPASIKQITIRPGSLPAAKQMQLLLKDGFNIIALSGLADSAAAKAAIEAALTKRFVFTGLAADNATTGLKTLQQISRSHLAPVAVSLSLGQAFVPSLCAHCREAYEPSEVEQAQLNEIFHINRADNMEQIHELEKLAIKAGLADKQPLSSSSKGIHRLWRADPHGCKYCDHTGHDAEIGIFEVCSPSDRLRKQLADNEPVAELQSSAIQAGMISLPVDALIKALRGLIDLQALLSIYLTSN